MTSKATRSDFALYRRLLGYAVPYWPYVIGLFLLGLLASPLALLNPLPLKIAVDSVLGSTPLPSFLETVLPAGLTTSKRGILLFAVALLVALALLDQLRDLGYSWLKAYVNERLTLDFRTDLFARAQRVSLRYHDTVGTADTLYRIQHDAQALNHLVVDNVISLIVAVVTVVAMMYVTMRLDWQLALVAFSVTPALFIVSAALRRRVRADARKVKRLESGVLGVIQETLGALRVVKAFGQENRETRRFARHGATVQRARLRLVMLENAGGVLVGGITAAGTALVVYIGVNHVITGTLTLGQLLLIAAYLRHLYSPLRTISRRVSSIQNHLASAERALTLLDEPVDVPERPHAGRLTRARGAVTFRQVSFAYDSEHPVLENVSFEVEPGSRVAITGTTGAGKTTVVSLLMRFYDPTAGAILLDGTNLRDYRLSDLRAQFSIVLQHPVLFSTTIAENIAYARPQASEADIVAAAHAANAHDFIMALPKGYATPVGDRGMKLSGGERQRIALARAFLKDAPILILDEPTSSVDMNTEAVILDALARLMHGRTVFLITHRPTPGMIWHMRLHVENGQLRSGRFPQIGPAPHAAAPKPMVNRRIP